jgi:hypothetical protein
MSVEYKVGTKLKSAVCDTQIMILRVPAQPIDLCIGGVPALSGTEAAPPGAEIHADLAGGSLTGKRYTDEAETMEFLCTKGGLGTITVNGVALGIKQAKALPSSD